MPEHSYVFALTELIERVVATEKSLFVPEASQPMQIVMVTLNNHLPNCAVCQMTMASTIREMEEDKQSFDEFVAENPDMGSIFNVMLEVGEKGIEKVLAKRAVDEVIEGNDHPEACFERACERVLKRAQNRIENNQRWYEALLWHIRDCGEVPNPYGENRDG